MEGKELELFTKEDFGTPKAYFRKVGCCILIDNIDRRDFMANYKTNYRMVVQKMFKEVKVFDEKSGVSRPVAQDQYARPISINEYLNLAQLLKNHGSYLYNKKLGKCIPKNH